MFWGQRYRTLCTFPDLSRAFYGPDGASHRTATHARAWVGHSPGSDRHSRAHYRALSRQPPFVRHETITGSGEGSARASGRGRDTSSIDRVGGRRGRRVRYGAGTGECFPGIPVLCVLLSCCLSSLAMFYGADLCLRYVSSRKSQCSAFAPRHAPAITGSYWYARRMCGRISPATFRLRVLECDFYLTMFASHMIQRSYLIGQTCTPETAPVLHPPEPAC